MDVDGARRDWKSGETILRRIANLTDDNQRWWRVSRDTNADDRHDPKGPTIVFGAVADRSTAGF